MKLLQVIHRFRSANLPERYIQARWANTVVQHHDTKTQEVKIQETEKLERHFVKRMFVGKFDTDMLTFPEVLEIDKLKELENKVASIETLLHNNTPILQQLEEMKNLGIFGIHVPHDYGGGGFSATEYTRFCEAISQNIHTAIALTAHQNYGTRGLLLAGNRQQKENYLPRLTSGELVGAFCFAEPSSVVDVTGIETEAKLSDDGDIWCINGSKILISGGGNADLITLIAKTDKDEFAGRKSQVLTAFLVERTFSGVSFEKTTNLVGDRGAKVCEVIFNNTPVPATNMLGNIGGGYKISADVLGCNRFTTGSFSAGILKQLLANVITQCISHKQFGKNFINFEIIKEKIARIVHSVYILESMSYVTAGILDNYNNTDVSVESAIVKVLSSELLVDGILECQNILGTAEFLKNYMSDTILRDARVFMLLEGSNEVLRPYIALSGLQHAGNELQDDVDKIRNPLMHPAYILKRMMEKRNHERDTPKLTLGLDGYLHPSLQNSAHQLEYGVHRLKFVVEILLTRYGREVIEKEIELNRLADIAMGLYAMTCVLARASHSYCTGIQDSEYEVRTAQAICYNISKIVKSKAMEIQGGPVLCLDKVYMDMAERVYERKGYFIEHPLTKNIF